MSPVACFQADIPEHTHNQTLLFLNWTHSLTYALSPSWQISASLPLQLRQIRISYFLLDETPYTPPYAGMHHRNEMLLGIGDPQLSISHIVWWNSWGIMPSLSTSIPLGKTEENPYLRASQGLQHQHIQQGSGSFVPSVGISLFRDETQWGMLHTITHSIPLYENSYQYKPGSNTRWSIGYWKRISPKIVFMPQVRGTHESSERWMDLPYGGQDAFGIILSSFIRVHKDWELGIQLERNVWIRSRVSEEEPINPMMIWNISITR